jgi:hypothetical protein
VGNPIALPEIFKQGMQDFVTPDMITAPFTTIQNRPKVSNSLKAIAGIERVMVKAIEVSPSEFGPNGEVVYKLSNGDSRIRFVGTWRGLSDNIGSYARTDVVNDFMEVTFYGTGLNLLSYSNLPGTKFSVDGGAETTDVIAASGSTVLNSRNYGSNSIYTVVSGLSLGWHTVKLRNSQVTLLSMGVEILNERSDVGIAAGKAIAQGSSIALSSLSSSAFKVGVIGSRGARIVKYLQNGVISQSIQEVDSISKFLSSTDHTNEELIRKINWREFGANRSDDFSTMTAGTTTSAAFTLDDGTTTLMGSSVAGSLASDLFISLANGFVTLTFVGTGLDIVRYDGGTTIDNHSLTIDGVAQGSLSPIGVATTSRVTRIASGLPYGTHTVKITRTAVGGGGVSFTDFIIYQPKKPVIPSAAFEVADYNIIADFVANSTVSLDNLAQGIVRKMAAREAVYTGTFSVQPVSPTTYIGGYSFFTTTVGNTITWRFWGTGFDARGFGGTTNTVVVSVDGSSNLSGFTTSAYGGAFTASTGTMVISAAPVSPGLVVNGLALGWHTVIFTKNAGASGMYIDAFDVITPIHINEPSFKIGSQSLRSNQNYDVIKPMNDLGPDLSKAKAWVVFDPSNTKILKSFNVSSILTTATGSFNVYFEKPFKDTNYAMAYLGDASQCYLPGGASSKKQGYVIVNTAQTNATALTPTHASLIFFGELVDE